MKRIFVYFSLTGNGDYLASIIKDKGIEIRKVEEKHKASKIFFFRILGGGFRAGLNLKGKLINYNPDVSEYDEVIIGSPIWNGRFPPAINSVLEETDLSSKKVSFILYSGSGEGKKAEEKIKKNYPSSNVVFLKEPKSHPDEIKKLIL